MALLTPFRMAQEFLVTNRHGQPILCKWHGDKDLPTILLCHGLCSSGDCFLFRSLNGGALLKKFSTVTFDFPLFMPDGHFRYGNYYEDAEDIKEILGEVQATFGKQCAALLGHSRGASVALLFAAKYQHPGLVIAIAGRFEMSGSLQKHPQAQIQAALSDPAFSFPWQCRRRDELLSIQVSGADLQKILSVEQEYEHLRNYKGKVLLVHGDSDEIVPPSNGRQFLLAIPDCRLEVIKGADHFFRKEISSLQALIEKFLCENGSRL